MACRKAAYRAQIGLSEHMEKVLEEEAKRKEAFEKECEAKWTPANVRDECCLQWLAYGPELPSHRPQMRGVLAASRGCSGGCLNAHPRITLEFKGNTTTASLSHALDPFVKHFEDLLGLTQMTPLKYQLKGVLSTHVELLKDKFGSHLIKVSTQALAASQRAHERWLEQEDLERQAKKRKVRGKAAENELLETVLEVCYAHSFLEHLDLAEIAWMRLSCKTMAKIAARLATTRMQQIQLSYSVLIDGRSVAPQLGGGRPPEEGRLLSNNQLGAGLYEVAASHCSLSQTAPSQFVPQDPLSVEWDSGRMGESDRFSYQGHCIRVYLERNNSACPERPLLFSQPLEVARYRLDPGTMTEGLYDTSTSNVAQVPRKQQRHQSTSFPNCSYKVISNQTQTHDDGSFTYKGKFQVESITFTFEDLLGVHVRKKLPIAKAHYQNSAQKRPTAKQYVKALAKAAREAPGNATAFQGMMGW